MGMQHAHLAAPPAHRQGAAAGTAAACSWQARSAQLSLLVAASGAGCGCHAARHGTGSAGRGPCLSASRASYCLPANHRLLPSALFLSLLLPTPVCGRGQHAHRPLLHTAITLMGATSANVSRACPRACGSAKAVLAGLAPVWTRPAGQGFIHTGVLCQGAAAAAYDGRPHASTSALRRQQWHALH